jgi:hypothetical protein
MPSKINDVQGKMADDFLGFWKEMLGWLPILQW